ncbi:MAG TPA: POTRA domain-containing protein [Chitinophagaceae bacterium]|nr:POTRA domain-containing protein [Chitinophagaceae bacterium]
MAKYLTAGLTTLSFAAIIYGQSDQTKLSPTDTSLTIFPRQTESGHEFIVRNIVLSGNKKTRESIILRELPFKSGDTYVLSELVKKFEDARRQLLNLVLFHEVLVAVKGFEENKVDILVAVKERWYLFPVPYVKVIDRNINQWIVEHNASLDRINYGIKVLYNNVTGRNDKLNLWIMSGYTRQISLSYDRPYIDKNMKWGLNAGLALGRNREVNYNTIENKQVFFKDTNNFVRSFFKALGEVTYRRAIKTRHRFGISFTEERITDTVVALNPSYFTKGRDKIAFPEFYYLVNYVDVDYIPYPLKGYMAEAFFMKKGLNNIINMWQVSARASGSWQIANKMYFGTRVSGSLKFPFQQPYINQRLLGYSDFFMQGYEYYVVDGVAGGYAKATLTREILNLNFRVHRKKDVLSYGIPFRVYGKIYGNAGYMFHPTPGQNTLNNRMLYSWGVGVDIITHYDFMIKLEWSFNQLGQNGLYLHRKTFY